MVDVANFLVSVDIHPNSCHWSLLSVRRLKFVKSFIKLARFLLCGMRKLGIIIIALVVLGDGAGALSLRAESHRTIAGGERTLKEWAYCPLRWL